MKTEKPMRILYILNSCSGGATQGIIEMTRNLHRDDFESFFITPENPTFSQKTIFSEVAIECFTVPMSWWNCKINLPWYWQCLSWIRDWFKTIGHIKSLYEICSIIHKYQIDIVYTNTVLVIDGALAAKICGIPHIWHLKEWIGQYGRVKFGIPDRFLVKILSKLSTYIIVMTDFIGEIFNKYKLGNKIQVIYDGVNIRDFQGDLRGKILRQELGIPKDNIVIAMSASLSSIWKQHDIFLEMAILLVNQFSNLEFVAFGSKPQKKINPIYNQPWNYFQRLEEKVNNSILLNNFHWGGFCPNIPQMMDSIDILVHPCENEPFGRVVIEAMAAKRPVVGPNKGGIAESVVHQYTGLLVESSNPKAFAKAVSNIIYDSQLRNKLGMNGYNLVKARFTIEQHVQKITNLYNDIKINTIENKNNRQVLRN